VDFKKNIFWIVIAVVVLAGIAVWAIKVPAVNTVTTKNRDDCLKKVDAFKKLAENANKDDNLKNPKHIRLAEDYKRKVGEQVDALKKELQARKLAVRFDDAPADSGRFDIWLSELRAKLAEKAKAAGLQLPADADKLMFKEPSTDDKSAEVERHRDYRLRQMAIIEEVVNVLCKKVARQQVLRFEADKDKAEPQEQVDASAIAFERIVVAPPKSMLASKEGGKAAGKSSSAGKEIIVAAEDRARNWTEDAYKRAGRQSLPSRTSTVPELPYAITSVDVQFVAPLVAVPAIAQGLETSERWAAVASRIEYQRCTAPFPPANDPKMAKAGPVPGLNTHYQEAPVRALVSLDLYEYDEAKAKAAAAAAAAAAQPKAEPKKK